MNFKDLYDIWSKDSFFDASTQKELADIANDEQEIEERFYKDLEFGTGGLRGILGAGTNRMNVYTVAKASAGLAQYIVANGKEAMEKGVAVSFDSRHFSPEFADVTASTLAAYGIKVYLSDELRPVPMLSYAVRYFGAFSGVMITASHNPSKYNGYKVYGVDGGQVTPEAASEILSNIEKYADVRTIKQMKLEDAISSGLVEKFGSKVDEAYTAMLQELVIDKDAIDRQSDMDIVYTPLHGSGNKPVRRILSAVGFKNVHIVNEQELPDESVLCYTYYFQKTQAKCTLDLNAWCLTFNGRDTQTSDDDVVPAAKIRVLYCKNKSTDTKTTKFVKADSIYNAETNQPVKTNNSKYGANFYIIEEYDVIGKESLLDQEI